MTRGPVQCDVGVSYGISRKGVPAPASFKRNDDGGYSFVYHQPSNPEEEKLAKEAMEGCPVEAIGSNGA